MTKKKCTSVGSNISAVSTTTNETIPTNASNSIEIGNFTMSPIQLYSMHESILTRDMQSKLDFLAITDTQLQCYISPPTSIVLNMEDVCIDNIKYILNSLEFAIKS